MTAIFMDSYDTYGTGTLSSAAMTAGPYATVGIGTGIAVCGAPPWGPARTGNSCLVMPSSAEQINGPPRKVLPTAGSHFFVSFGLAVDALVAGDYFAISFMDSGANILFELGWNASGGLALYQPPASGYLGQGAIIAQTAGPVIVSENWHFFEMEVNTSAHTFTLRVDDATGTGTPVLTISNSLITGTIAQLGLLRTWTGSGFSTPSYMDDLFIRDSSGTYNNGWLGDRRVATLFVNADSTPMGWTPSYYKEFGAGILTLSHVLAGTTTIQNTSATVATAHASALDIGASDFTLETFVRFDAVPTGSNYSTIFNRWDTTTNQRSYRLLLGSQAYNNSCLQFDISTDGTAATVQTEILYPWAPTPNTWYHLALVRAAGELLLFVNGQQFGLPIADANTYFSGGTEPMSIGLEVQGAGTGTGSVAGSNLIGRLDETRFTNGTGRYTGSFSPPTAAFPRGSLDPDWSQVVWLMGYDSGIIDESGFNRTLSAQGGAVFFVPSDGPAIGVYSTLNKATPDDNTFISAGLTNATNILTMTTQPANGDTVTVGTKNGSTAAVYTFKTAISTAFDVLIDTTAQNSLINLMNAINAGAGAGIKYGTGTTSNYDVNAVQLPVGQIEVIANLAGSGGNSIPSTSTGTAAHWATSTLTGGASIPGPSNFKFYRPPNNTTIVSALQTTIRALKTDAGTANVQTALIGPLGGTETGAIHALTVSANYYSDIIETDPDTTGPLSPTTIINGKFQINRTS